MRPAITLRRTRELKITGKEGTMRFVLGTRSGTGAMWCRASLGGDISPLFGSLGILRDRYVVVVFLCKEGSCLVVEKLMGEKGKENGSLVC